MIKLNRILVATDFGEASDAALMYGRALAREFGAAVDVLHVADDLSARVMAAGEGYVGVLPEIQRDQEAAARNRLAQLVIDNDPDPVRMTPVMVTSNTPAPVIVQHARQIGADLIVIGTHGRGALERFFTGSVTDRVVRTAGCPVLVVRHPEHEFVQPDTLVATPSA